MPLLAMTRATCWLAMPAMIESPVEQATTPFMVEMVMITSSLVPAQTTFMLDLESIPSSLPAATWQKTPFFLTPTASIPSCSRVMAVTRPPPSRHRQGPGILAPRGSPCWMAAIPLLILMVLPPTTRSKAQTATTTMNSVAQLSRTLISLPSETETTASAPPPAPKASRSPTTAAMVQTASR